MRSPVGSAPCDGDIAGQARQRVAIAVAADDGDGVACVQGVRDIHDAWMKNTAGWVVLINTGFGGRRSCLGLLGLLGPALLLPGP